MRLGNIWTGRYLNVQSDSENANIVTYDRVPEWTRQQWTIEPVSGSSDVRLLNVWTGRYLTVVGWIPAITRHWGAITEYGLGQPAMACSVIKGNFSPCQGVRYSTPWHWKKKEKRYGQAEPAV